MAEQTLLNISLIIFLLPLFGFILVIFFGKRFEKIYRVEIGILVLTFILALIVNYFKLTLYPHKDLVFAFTWLNFSNLPGLGDVHFELGIKIDSLSGIMLLVVTLISSLVHIYSVGYMEGDKRFNRYYAYLGLFTFSMLGIVLTHNFLLMYISWELVGLASYLLIGFWYEKDSAADAGKKAFLTTRLGDIGMFLGILILYTQYHTFTFDEIFHQISLGNLPFGSGAWLTAAGILLFLGAVGKSAQFPLHVWLPDAMEGPTPVSALIHSATMVAAGVYFMARIFSMLTADALLVVGVIGAITAFIAATIALTQNDIKKVLAYSTISQLGYMILSIGVGAYTFAVFHMVTHAIFKSGLFLGSGSVIHSMHGEQDMREMGGLKKKMPITYWAFIVFTLAISGIPLMSGFLSKDGILLGSFAFATLTGHWLLPFSGFLVAGITALYMFRLILMTFHGSPRNIEKYDHAHESPKVMTMPLIILSALSIFIFYTPNPVSPEAGWFYHWIGTSETVVPQDLRFDFMKSESPAEVHNEAAVEHSSEEEVLYSTSYMEALHEDHIPALSLSILLAILGILTAYILYEWKKVDVDKLTEKVKPLYTFSLNKWYFDELYYATFVAGTIGLSKALRWFDVNIVDGIVNGTATLGLFVSRVAGLFDKYVVDGLVNFSAFFSGFLGLTLRKFQTGKVQTYVAFVVLSLFILFWVFI
ncbi:MAG: NADH-quinone oxidoreductase subunit L [Chlorobi bacterium]|nr:NADH-quinone oxidoreductase subunit L [Chlorobiota bacterium]